MITSVQVKAPCRIDIGGTWDIPLLMLSGQQYSPCTIAIALDMPIVVNLTQDKGIIIINDGVIKRTRPDQLDFNSLIECIIGYFGADNIKLEITYNCPKHAGLGGSGVLCAAIVQALSEFLSRRVNVLELAHDIEHGNFSMTGYQDQLSAMYGGINYYEWNYPMSHVEIRSLLGEDMYDSITDRLLLASIGSHNSTDVNLKQMASYRDPKTRPLWIEINEITKEAAKAIEAHDWDSLAQYIAKEHEIRNTIVPERIKDMDGYIKICNNFEVGYGTPGAGQAAIFAFGEPEKISLIKPLWENLGCKILSSKIAKGCNIGETLCHV